MMNACVITNSEGFWLEVKPFLDEAGFTAIRREFGDTGTSPTLELPALVIAKCNTAAAWSFIRSLRALPEGASHIVWAVVERMDSQAEQNATSVEADDYLAWPLDRDRLRFRLAAARRRLEAIEEMRRARAEFAADEERWSLVQQGARGGIWDSFPEGAPLSSPDQPVWFSPEMKKLLGYSDDEFPNVLGSWMSRLHPEDRPTVVESVRQSLEKKEEFEIQYRLRNKQGNYVWFNGRGRGVYDSKGQVVRIVGSVRDITENRRVAEALQASEAKWRSLVENAPDIISVVDLDGTIQFMNRDWPGLAGADSIGKNLVALAPAKRHDEIQAALKEVAESGRPTRFEINFSGPDGKLVWYGSRVGPILNSDGVTALVIITTDITFRKRAEEEREQFVATIENSSDFIAMMEESKKLLHVNPAGCKLIGLEGQHRAKDISLSDVYAPDSRSRYEEEILPALSSTGRWTGEIRFRNFSNGQPIDVHQKIFVIRNPQSGAPLCLATISRDIRARKRQEAELQQEQELLRKLLDLHERDRQLVAYEIHDGLAQSMAAALMHLQAFQHIASEQLGGNEFERGLTLLREAVQETRRLISGLRPPVLDELGIVAAIEYLINENRTEVPDIQFTRRTRFVRLAPPLESAIFRIVQEALSNIRLHSGSRRAKIELYENGQHLRLVVRDWGQGFDMAHVNKSRFGLQGIQQRARLLGGKVIIESRPGEGTSVVVDFPLILDRKDDGAERGISAAK